MPPNETAPTFTDEDRARVERVIAFNREQIAAFEDDELARAQWFDESCLGSDLIADADSLTRALAYITHLEGAVEAAIDFLGSQCNCLAPGHKCAACKAADPARAALSTSKED